MSVIFAILRKIGRDIVGSFQGYIQFLRLKMRWHGIVRFNRSVRMADDAMFEGANSIGDGSYFSGHMGYGSYMCGGCYLEGTIGRFSSIGADVRSARGTHPIAYPYATTSPVFFSLRKQAMDTFATAEKFDELLPHVTIGNDCWIGNRVEIKGGTTVSDGAVVLAGAVVTHDVPPYAVVGGVPAKILRYRYDDATIAWLLKVRWWDKPIDWLRENWELMCDMDKLREALDDN